MKKIVLILMASVSLATAQTISTFAPKISNIPSSPEAALFQRFGDIPVGYYTGTASISIPIYTLKGAGLTIPIELRYNSSGIKVADEATWVGLGWDLSPGGAIVQEVRGKRDDEDVFYYPTQPEGYDYLKYKISMNGPADNYKTMWHACGYDPDDDASKIFFESPLSTADIQLRMRLEEGGGQPDIYNFNFAGYSGKFYINFETQQIVQMDKKDEIFFERVGFNSFTATTQDGNTFHFNVLENAYNYNSSVDVSVKAGRTFKLSQIDLVNGKHIYFTYTTTSLYSKLYSESTYIVTNCDGENSHLGIQATEIQSDVKVLTQISTEDTVIDFVLEDREDLIAPNIPGVTPPKRLKQIDISAKGDPNEKIRSFQFNYSYFPYDPSLGIASVIIQPIPNIATLGKRLKLDSVKEIGYEGVTEVSTKPAYRFDYNMDVTMPLKISCSKDFWGYFNGAPNTSLLPNLEYFDFENDPEYKQVYVEPNGMVHPHTAPFQYRNYVGVNRFTNTAKTGAYMLNKITYPTGGSSKFEYEPNTFTNQFVPNNDQINASYKHTLLDHDGTNATYRKSFVLSKTTTISFTNRINDGYSTQSGSNPNFPVYPLSAFSGSKIVFSKVKILSSGQSQSTIIKEWQANDTGILTSEFETNHSHTWNDSFKIDYDPDKSVYYTVEVINTLNYIPGTYHVAAIKADFHFYDDTGVNTATSYGCGLRIKSIKSFSENGVLISNKRLEYSNGKLLNRFRPLISRDTYCVFMPGDVVNGQDIQNVRLGNTVFISSDGLVQTSGTSIGYGTVQERELGNASGNNGKKVFIYFNSENLNYNGLPTIVNDVNGLISQEEIYDASGNPKSKTSYNYENLSLDQPYFYGTINFHLMSGFASSCVYTFEGGGARDYMLVSYPLITTFYKIKTKTTREYFGSNIVEQAEEYTYNTYGNVKEVSKFNSDNEELTTRYFYPTDTPVMVNQSLINNHMTGIVLTKQELNGTNVLSTQRTDYDVFGSLLMPKSISASKGNDPAERKVTFDAYDDKGNILQYTLENGTPVSFKWDTSKTMVLAKAENATYQQAENVGFNPVNLPEAMVTRYEYKKLIGVTKITDPKGEAVHYEYDAFGQLKTAKDRDQKILSEYEYHFSPQN